MKTAVQKPNGNFSVINDSGLELAVIVHTSLGWRVMTRTQGRNSRTFSQTPQQAADKYYGKGSVEFLFGQPACEVLS